MIKSGWLFSLLAIPGLFIEVPVEMGAAASVILTLVFAFFPIIKTEQALKKNFKH